MAESQSRSERPLVEQLRSLADSDPNTVAFAGQAKQLMKWAADTIEAANDALATAPRSERGALPFVLEYRAKPEHMPRATGAWIKMAAFDYEAAAEGYMKSCASGDVPWEYRIVGPTSAERPEIPQGEKG